MDRATGIIAEIASRSDEAILFHSASGKDSIALLDLMAPHFRRVVCVYMYIVKDLQHINRYIRYAKQRYPNVEFVQVPHFARYNYLKTGYMGCECDPKQRQKTLAQITDAVRGRYGIEWAFFGFKKADGLNRRVMLQRYDKEAICEKSHKCYPLSSYKNGDVLAYIDQKGLIRPERYGKGASSGTDISDPEYLAFLRDNFPGDLQKVFREFPMTERILFEYAYANDENQ